MILERGKEKYVKKCIKNVNKEGNEERKEENGEKVRLMKVIISQCNDK